MATRERQAADGRLEERIEALLAAQPGGSSLLAPLYLDEEVYRAGLERMLLRHWLCVGHASQVPEPGDWFTFEIDAESVIVVRGRDGVVRALANTCRHRGSRICYGRSGHADGAVLVCPYHAWVYEADGALRAARMMPEGFDRAAHGLGRLPCRVVEGLVFVTFADDPLGLDEVEHTVTAALGPYGWGAARVIHEESYVLAADWKLCIENQMECYHCAPTHPDYTRLHSQARPGTAEKTAAMQARTAAMGIAIPSRDQWALRARPGQEADYSVRYAMWDGIVTGSEDGQPVAPPMGRFTGFDGGSTFVYAGPASFFIAYTDHGAIFRWTPLGPGRTELRVTWLVDGAARAGVDYETDRVTWLWRVTSEADREIIEQNARGVASRAYRPGPYAQPIEASSQRFAEWFLHDLAR